MSKEEYVEVQELYLHSTHARFKWMRYGLSAIYLFSITTVLLTSHSLSGGDWSKVVGFGVFTLFLLLFPRLMKRGARKRFLVEAPGLTDIRVQIDAIGYKSSAPGQGACEVPWSAFTSYGESKNMLAIYKGFTFHAIPKRVLSEADLAEGRELIASRLPKLTAKLAKTQGR